MGHILTGCLAGLIIAAFEKNSCSGEGLQIIDDDQLRDSLTGLALLVK
tara:strand:+ start:34689 stop:34832 length:144 start_codon:yes stop_codon:yes gene_type:complete